ncbi:nucleotide-diphospho-sugar transferase [Limtongia smithiae]|uniref:nucleotide-diphospho-sugar transferase n=1 Tax=Limtongia smithiae TaxID=1125753 RepID=UPI0034CFF3D5
MGPAGPTRIRRQALLAALGCILLIYLLFHSSSSLLDAAMQPGALLGAKTLSADSTPEDIALFRQSATRRLQRLFPYDLKYQRAYPRHVWQTWKYRMADMRTTPSFRRRAQTWDEFAKDGEFTHEVLDDESANAMVRQVYSSVPDVVEAYFSMPVPILRADFFRYLILFARGGIYSDMDTVPLKPLGTWLARTNTPSIRDHSGKEALDISDGEAGELTAEEALERLERALDANTGLAVGIEADPDRPDWHDWYARRVQFCQWTMVAKRGHPVLARLIAHITTETLRRKVTSTLALPDTKDAGSQIMDWTGPGIWTDTIFQYLDEQQPGTTWKSLTGAKVARQFGDVLVLPITAFSPGVNTMGAGQISHPHALVQHTFEGSWKPEDERIL